MSNDITTREDKKKDVLRVIKRLGYDVDINGETFIDEAFEEARVAEKEGVKIGTQKQLGRLLSTFEFEKGGFLIRALPEEYMSFGLEYFRGVHAEYNCSTPIENAIAELIALSFIQSLYIQAKMKGYLSKDTINDVGAKYLNYLSTELDRAHKRYFVSLQTLRELKTPKIEMNVRAQTAIIGNNQVIQANNKDNTVDSKADVMI